MKKGINCDFSEDLKLGSNFKCGNGVIIGKNVSIGDNVSIGHYVIIGDNVNIGDDVKIEHHCLIHNDVIVGKGTLVRSFVELRNKTSIGENCYIDSFVKSSGKNKIGNNVTLRYSSIIARGCEIGNDVYICPQVMTNNLNHKREQIGGAKVGDNSFVGTQTVLGAGLEIAPKVIVGSCSMVTKNLEEEAIYIGVPAKKMNK